MRKSHVKNKAKNNFEFQHSLESSHFTFSKLLWSEITGFKIHNVKFFFVKMSFSFYSFIYSFSIRLYSQEVTMVLFTASSTNLNLLADIHNKAAFRYYSLLRRRQALAAKVLSKMHTNHLPCWSWCYASLTSYSALLPALASRCLLHWTAASADSQLAMEISVVKEFKGPGTVHV